MPLALSPLLLLAPHIGAFVPTDAVVAPLPASARRVMDQHGDDGFVIVDRDLPPLAQSPTPLLKLGSHVSIDHALVETRGFPCAGIGR